MSFTRRVAAPALIAAISVACGAMNPSPVVQPAPTAGADTPIPGAQSTPGTTSSASGTIASGVVVSGVITTADRLPLRNRRFRVIRSDAGGRYRVRGLPPGEYHVFASVDLDESDVYRRDVLDTLVATAAPLSVVDEGFRALDLPLSVPPYRRSSSR